MTERTKPLDEVRVKFEARSKLSGVGYETKRTSTGETLILYLSNPTERHFKLLEEAIDATQEEYSETIRATLKRRAPLDKNLLSAPEGRCLLRAISESLSASRYTAKSDFFSRYIKSASGAEEQVISAANHIVFGRRGAGKSSLLLYAMLDREREGRQSIWIDMQVYERRSDEEVIADVLTEILDQAKSFIADCTQIEKELAEIKNEASSSAEKLRILFPDIRRLFAPLGAAGKDLAVYLDDFHVLGREVQPRLLSSLYAISRGNNIFLNMSCIETLTQTWDQKTREGLQIPNDAQTIDLDLNLTTPENAIAHINTILDTQAVYCGLPSIRSLCSSSDVIPRLVWATAGVPRDALNIFSQAMTKAALKGMKKVTVTLVNAAASEMVSDKQRDLGSDVNTEEEQGLNETIEKIRRFCVTTNKKNAFLVEIKNEDPEFHRIQELIDLRLLHVIHEGITPSEAGRKFLALILDYGFYVGIRAAKSVELFNQSTERVAYKDLRNLPIFKT